MDEIVLRSKPARETRQVYLDVVDQVITNVKAAFLDEGSDEQVLEDLRSLWLSNLYEQRTMDTGMKQVDGADDDDDHGDGDGHAQAGSGTGTAGIATHQPAQGTPGDHLQQQGEGQASATEQPASTPTAAAAEAGQQQQQQPQQQEAHGGPQQATGAEQASAQQDNDESLDDDGNPYGDDDDGEDAEDEDDEDEEADSRPNNIICQHERINHSKQTWKAALKNCVVHVDGKDFVFGSMKLEYVW